MCLPLWQTTGALQLLHPPIFLPILAHSVPWMYFPCSWVPSGLELASCPTGIHIFRPPMPHHVSLHWSLLKFAFPRRSTWCAIQPSYTETGWCDPRSNHNSCNSRIVAASKMALASEMDSFEMWYLEINFEKEKQPNCQMAFLHRDHFMCQFGSGHNSHGLRRPCVSCGYAAGQPPGASPTAWGTLFHWMITKERSGIWVKWVSCLTTTTIYNHNSGQTQLWSKVKDYCKSNVNIPYHSKGKSWKTCL